MTIERFTKRIEEAIRIDKYVSTASDVDEKLAMHEVRTLEWVLAILDEETKAPEHSKHDDELPLLAQSLQEIRSLERWLGWEQSNMNGLREFATERRDDCEREATLVHRPMLSKHYNMGKAAAFQAIINKIDHMRE